MQKAKKERTTTMKTINNNDDDDDNKQHKYNDENKQSDDDDNDNTLNNNNNNDDDDDEDKEEDNDGRKNPNNNNIDTMQNDDKQHDYDDESKDSTCKEKHTKECDNSVCNKISPREQHVFRRSDLIALELLEEPIWIFDIERRSMWWANIAAYEIWNCTCLTELLQRDYDHDMSDSTRRRLDDNLAKYNNNEKTYETWTYYPNGTNVPSTCFITGSGIRIVDDDDDDNDINDNNGEKGQKQQQKVPRMAMLNEVNLKEKNEKLISETTLRELEMLRHLPVAVAQFDASNGQIINQNPESLHLFTNNNYTNSNTNNTNNTTTTTTTTNTNTNNNHSKCSSASSSNKTTTTITITKGCDGVAAKVQPRQAQEGEVKNQHDDNNNNSYDSDDSTGNDVIDRHSKGQAQAQAPAEAEAEARDGAQAEGTRAGAATQSRGQAQAQAQQESDFDDQNQQHDDCRVVRSTTTTTTARNIPTESSSLSSSLLSSWHSGSNSASSSSASNSYSYNCHNNDDSHQAEQGAAGDVGYHDSKSTAMTATTTTTTTTTTIAPTSKEGGEGGGESSCHDAHDVECQPRCGTLSSSSSSSSTQHPPCLDAPPPHDFPSTPSPSSAVVENNNNDSNNDYNINHAEMKLVNCPPDLSMFVDRFVDRELGRYILNKMRRSTASSNDDDESGDSSTNTNGKSNNNDVDDYQVDAQQYTADGSIRWFSIRVRRRRDPITGQHIILCSARDITDIVMAKHEATIADQQNMQKSEFLAVMAHEIRTPLHQVIGFIELLAQTSLSDEQTEYVNLLQNSTVSLMSVINDTLDYTKLEAGQMQLEKLEFDIRDVCEGCIMAIEPKAHGKGLQTKINVSDDDIPTMIYGDPNRVRQILLNLLHNAVKFTHEPGGNVSLVVTRHYPDNDKHGRAILDFVVEDTGIGINEQHIQRIFDRYHQANSSVSRTYGGTGLGLTISKILTETMDGTISVESEVGKGSRFTIQIPFEVVNNDDDDKNHDKQHLRSNTYKHNDNKDCDNRSMNSPATRTSTSCLSASFSSPSSFSSSSAEINSLRRQPRNDTDVGNERIKGLDNNDDDANNKNSVRDSHHCTHNDNKIADNPTKDCCAMTMMTKSNSNNGNNNVNKKKEHHHRHKHQQPMKKTLNILVVEDNKVNQKLAVAMLRRMGHHAIIVENGLEAVQYVVNNKNKNNNDNGNSNEHKSNDNIKNAHDDHCDNEALDLVLMDVQMPVMDGIEATKEIRRLGFETLPIVGLTADFRKADLNKKYLSIGMNDCIGKPMRMHRLNIAMENAIITSNINNHNSMITTTTTAAATTSSNASRARKQ